MRRWVCGLFGCLLLSGILPHTLAAQNPYILPEIAVMVYTDRPGYQYGDPIYFRAIVRDQSDFTYSVPTLERVIVSLIGPYNMPGGKPIYDPDGGRLLEEYEAPLSSYGTITGQFTAPAYKGAYTVAISDCSLRYRDCQPVYHGGIWLTISPPPLEDFDIQLSISKVDWIAGEALQYETQVIDSAGRAIGPVESPGFVSLSYPYDPPAYRNIFPELTLEAGFQFYSPEILQPPRFSYYWDGMGDYLFTPRSGTLEPVTLLARLGDVWRARSFTVAPARFFTGLRPDQLSVPVGTAHTVDLLTVDNFGAAQPNQAVQLYVEQVDWRATYIAGVYSTEKFQLSTDSDGRAQFEFIPENAGAYQLRTATVDEVGRIGETVVTVFAHPAEPSRSEWISRTAENDQCDDGPHLVRLIPDQPLHRPGEQMQVLVINPTDQPQQAQIMVEREDVLWQQDILLAEDATVVSIPVLPLFAPASLLTVRLLDGTDEIDADGWALLNVEPVQQRLNIDIALSNRKPQPGETVTARFHLTDWEGQAVQAEVGVALLHEGAYQVFGDNPLVYHTLEEVFYPRGRFYDRPSWAYWTSARAGLFPENPDCAGDGRGFGLPWPIFAPTPFWTVVETDANGTASVTLTLPDRPADWRLEARVVTMETQVGEASLVFSADPS